MRKALFLGSVVALAACGPVAGAARDGDGARSFALAGFDSVRLAGSDNVRVVRGATFSVVAHGPNVVLDQLDIHTEGSTLIVTRKPRTGRNWTKRGATVVVTMPAIRAAQLAGSGDMVVDGAGGARFEGWLKGSGNFDLTSLSAAAVALDVTGSGNLRAAGAARTVALSVSGSGNLDARRLVSDTANISVRGSGNARGYARQSAAVTSAGSGNAEIAGTRNCTISKSGSGNAACTG